MIKQRVGHQTFTTAQSISKNVVDLCQIHIYVLHTFNGSDHFRNNYTNLMTSPEMLHTEATHIFPLCTK
jgi:hypothetical protein